MHKIYKFSILGIYVLCIGLVFNASKAYTQGFVLQPESSKSQNQYKKSQNSNSRHYTGSILIPRSFNNDPKNNYNIGKKQPKLQIYQNVYKSDSTLKKEAKDKEQARIKKRLATNEKIRKKMRIRNDKKMKVFYETQKKNAEEAKRIKNGASSRPPPKSFYKKLSN